jgi:hypothetical protein
MPPDEILPANPDDDARAEEEIRRAMATDPDTVVPEAEPRGTVPPTEAT